MFVLYLTLYSPVVTICTAQWSIYVTQSGHYIHRTVVTICTNQWSLYVPHSGHYMYDQFNIEQLYAQPTLYLCVLCLSENKQRLCHLQHKLIGFYSRDEKCLQRGTDWVFKYSGLRFVCKGLTI